jgi:riboflavin biosynthesis pyrimidine reductase
LRIVVSRHGDLDPSLHLVADDQDRQSVLLTANGAAALPSRVWRVDADADGYIRPQDILRKLGQEGVCSVLIEGGRRLFGDFISTGLVDKYIIVVAPRLLGSGRNAFEDVAERSLTESIIVKTAQISRVVDDVWLEAYGS